MNPCRGTGKVGDSNERASRFHDRSHLSPVHSSALPTDTVTGTGNAFCLHLATDLVWCNRFLQRGRETAPTLLALTARDEANSSALAVYPLRQTAFVQAESKFVTCRRGQLGQAVMQAQHKGGGGQGAQRNRGVTALQPPERITTDISAVRWNPGTSTLE